MTASNGKNAGPADTAVELMKQLIALSSGVLIFSATFIEKFFTESIFLRFILGCAWFSLIIAVLGGIETISAIVKSRLSSDYDWSKGYGKKSALFSKYSFVLGLILFSIFAFSTLISSSKNKDNSVHEQRKTTSMAQDNTD